MKQVKIACQGTDFASIDDFTWFQGSLKELPEENFRKLKGRILDLGFSEPVSAWLRDNERVLLNGHQRILTLKRMRDEGYKIPFIPYSVVEAENEEEAKRKVLSLTSQFGKITEAGLAEFIQDTTIEIAELKGDFELGPLDYDKIELPPINEGISVSVTEHSRTIGADKEEDEDDGFCRECGQPLPEPEPPPKKKTITRKKP